MYTVGSVVDVIINDVVDDVVDGVDSVLLLLLSMVLVL